MESIPHVGEIFALSSSLVWAAAVILFRISGRKVHPLGLNFFKTGLAAVILLLNLALIGQSLIPHVKPASWWMLLASGALGIGLSDTLLFACLNRLGAGLTAIIDCCYSPLVILLAALFLSERMAGVQILGAALIIAAVILITRMKNQTPIPRERLLSGIALGVAAMFVLAVSVVLMKPALNAAPVVWSTLIRALGGVLFLLVALAFRSDRKQILAPAFSPANWKAMLPGSLLGGYAALLIWMAGMKLTLASISSVLNQMTSVFIFVFGVIFLKEKASFFKLLALGLAVAGAILVTFP
jgi:drug/metabolite transporter (DMT)-like permease